MYTIICCSVDPEAAAALERNVARTIGVPFEFIAFDNRSRGWGLCKVYNECAARARYDLLCFIHEDVRFLTEGWGGKLAPQLRAPETGVVGFAGSVLKLRRMTGWDTCGRDVRANYVQHMRGRRHPRRIGPPGADYSPVVTLDGLCLLTRREVWRQSPFDERTFPGFHCYDLDFSLAAAVRHTNYVCRTVLVEHFSEGSFSRAWVQGMEALHTKWASHLPMCAEPLTEAELARYDRLGEGYFIRFMWQKGCFDVRGFRDAMRYLVRRPETGMAWSLLPKYVKYKLRTLLRKCRSDKR